MSSLPSSDMAAFKELLSSSKHIIAVAGAGLSAASGGLAFSPHVGSDTPRALIIIFRYPDIQRLRGYVAQIRRHEPGHVQRVPIKSFAGVAVLPL